MPYSKKRKKNPIGIITGITAALLLCAVLFYFFTTTDKFSFTDLLNGIFLAGDDNTEIENSYSTKVNIFALNNSYNFNVDFEAENTVFNYFTLYYGALGQLGQNELGQLYTYTSASGLFDGFVHSYITELRKSSPIMLTYPACDIELTYEKANEELNGEIGININISFSAAFDGLNGIISTERDLKHYFKLKKKSGKWEIDEHIDLSESGNYFNGIFETLINKNGYNRNDITLSYMPDYLKKMEILLKKSLYDLYDGTGEIFVPVYEEEYNRESAVAYAMQWSERSRKVRNYQEYAAYEDNSMNFVSQCIYAGGIPMDGLGTWQWYTDEPGSKAEKSDYSLSWINGKDFYEYALNNKNFGMAAAQVNIDKVEKGDVIQFLLPDIYKSEVIYQCLVTTVANGEPALTGNSGDIINMPLHALGYGTARAVKIYGFNASNMP